METGNIVAGNPKVFKAILQTIRPTLTPELLQGLTLPLSITR